MSSVIKRRNENRRLRPGVEGLENRVVLSRFRVNTMLDTVAVNLQTGKDATGHISLRSAIMAADAKGGNNTIILPAGTFTLTIPATGPDDVTTGDLDITGNLTIKGKNAARTVIDGNNLDRVFQILGGRVSISNLTIQHGRIVGEGGGILNSGGTVKLTAVRILNNVAVGVSGSKGADGVISGTSGDGGNGGSGTGGSDGEGGGIFNAAGALSISGGTIASNAAVGGTGGDGGDGGEGDGLNGTSLPEIDGRIGLGGNAGAGGTGGDGLGGGVFNAAGASLTLTGTTISANAANGGAGGLGGEGGPGIGGHGGADSGGGAGSGGEGFGGIAGAGGGGGQGEGAGLFNLGIVSVTGKASTFSANQAIGARGIPAAGAATASAVKAEPASTTIAAVPAPPARRALAARAAWAVRVKAVASSTATVPRSPARSR